MTITANLLTGVLITVLAIGGTHLLFRLLGIERDSLLFRVLRYAAGEIAILAGLTQVMDVHTLCILLGFIAIAGVTTIFCHLLFDRIDDRAQLTARAETAEEALDDGD